MNKLFLILNFLLLSTLVSQAQLKDYPNLNVPDHTPMMNNTWEIIDKMMYKVSTEGNKKVYTPHYPPELKRLENKVVDLPGYIVPLNSGRNHSTFMLSVLPIAQCQFCGSNGIPPMVEIFMKKGSIKYTEEPIKIKGKMKFNPEPLKGNAEIQIVDAELIH
ncbi:hypothetical protein [Sphingobacterium paucimobilis]|uniref:DUF3299 domain-containing protein n=1 Tax=Sphingobacterium paucimobilis HER1398 TaxID=1346330 RepID=U2HY74_9SPHI|nr:hypothetical protein [Sphingobacterium paucimobilis]ERJ60502.1 hypothetical protein M472_17265 [Sphingobacterium paucimobilis HER1398]